MSFKTWGIYSLVTGAFRASYSGPEGTIKEQLRDGEAAIEGAFDIALARVNPRTQAVEPWRPPSPGPGYEWADTRWVLTRAAAAALAKREMAERQIESLEASQARAVREALLSDPSAIEKLRAIDAKIVALRPDLAGT